MRWPWTRTEQNLASLEKRMLVLQEMQAEMREALAEVLPPLVSQVTRLYQLAADAEARRVEEDKLVGQSFLMSPGEQAQAEHELLAKSADRVRTRHYRTGSGK